MLKIIPHSCLGRQSSVATSLCTLVVTSLRYVSVFFLGYVWCMRVYILNIYIHIYETHIYIFFWSCTHGICTLSPISMFSLGSHAIFYRLFSPPLPVVHCCASATSYAAFSLAFISIVALSFFSAPFLSSINSYFNLLFLILLPLCSLISPWCLFHCPFGNNFCHFFLWSVF